MNSDTSWNYWTFLTTMFIHVCSCSGPISEWGGSHLLERCRADCGWSRRPRLWTGKRRLQPDAPHIPSSASPDSQRHALVTTAKTNTDMPKKHSSLGELEHTPNMCTLRWRRVCGMQIHELLPHIDIWPKGGVSPQDQTDALTFKSASFPEFFLLRQSPKQMFLWTFCSLTRFSTIFLSRSADKKLQPKAATCY